MGFFRKKKTKIERDEQAVADEVKRLQESRDAFREIAVTAAKNSGNLERLMDDALKRASTR